MFINPFTAKEVKYDPRQQNIDFARSDVSSRLKFCTGSHEVASDWLSHNMIGLDNQNLRNSNFNFLDHQNSRNSNLNLIFSYFQKKFDNFLSFLN